MKQKKNLLLCCLCCIAILCMTGCGCMHNYDEWRVDTVSHWHVCDKCGEEIDKASHDFSDGNQCKTCKFYTYPDESDMIVMESYDEMGAKSYIGSYDADGKLESSQRFENTYFENGMIESVKVFGYDSLTDEEGEEKPLWENHFLPYEGDEEDEVYLHLEVLYEMDGTKITREYNQAGELVKEERS